MIREQYTNAAATTLNGAINNSTTTVVVTDGSTFPTAGFRIKIATEIMYVSSRTTNTLTVVRGQEGTSAISHSDGLAVNHVITKGALDRFRLGVLADCGLVPYDTSLSSDDDEFDDENFSGWTTVQGSPNCTIVEKSHRATILIPSGSATAQQYAFVKAKSPSSGNWVQAGFQYTHGSGGGFPLPGVVIANGNTYGAGNQVAWAWSPRESNYILRPFTNYNTGGTAINYSNVLGNFPYSAMHMRLTWKGSNQYDGFVSIDGVQWAQVFSNVSCGSVGTPTHMGFINTSWAASVPHIGSFMYCRFNF